MAFGFFSGYATSIAIPDSVISIGESAFYRNNIQKVTIGSGVTFIGKNAFDSCEYLTSVIFVNPNGWRICDTADATNGAAFAEDISDPAVAAECLTMSNKYKNYYWKRVG